MSEATDNLQAAYERAAAIRPKVAGLSGRDPLTRGRDAQSVVPARVRKSLSDRAGAGGHPEHAAGE
jgi:hypothetical protein